MIKALTWGRQASQVCVCIWERGKRMCLLKKDNDPENWRSKIGYLTLLSGSTWWSTMIFNIKRTSSAETKDPEMVCMVVVAVVIHVLGSWSKTYTSGISYRSKLGKIVRVQSIREVLCLKPTLQPASFFPPNTAISLIKGCLGCACEKLDYKGHKWQSHYHPWYQAAEIALCGGGVNT